VNCAWKHKGCGRASTSPRALGKGCPPTRFPWRPYDSRSMYGPAHQNAVRGEKVDLGRLHLACEWERRRDAKEAELERERAAAEWLRLVGSTPVEQQSDHAVQLPTFQVSETSDAAAICAPARQCESARRRRLRIRACWRAREEEGWLGCCCRCHRVSMPHKGNGLCASCYAVERGQNKRSYRRRIPYQQEWERAHRAERLEYWRAYGARRRAARRSKEAVKRRCELLRRSPAARVALLERIKLRRERGWRW